MNLWEDVMMITPSNYEAIHELQRLLETQEELDRESERDFGRNLRRLEDRR